MDACGTHGWRQSACGRIKRCGAALAFAVLVGVTVPSEAQARKLYPVDEGKRNRSFSAFRQQLIKALRQWDRQFLLSVLDAKITYSVVNLGSVRGFKEYWDLDQPGRSWGKLRTELLTVLALGGSFKKGDFYAPYPSSKWPEDPNDPDGGLFSGCILGRRIPVRSRPSAKAPIFTRLSYDIVDIPEWRDGPWVEIITPKGWRGYVASHSFRSPGDYSAIFEKIKGRWKLVFFLAGD